MVQQQHQGQTLTPGIIVPEKTAAQCWWAKPLCGNSRQIWLIRLPKSSIRGGSIPRLRYDVFSWVYSHVTVTEENLRPVSLISLSRSPHVCSHCPQTQQQIPEGHILFPGTGCALPLNPKQALQLLHASCRRPASLVLYPQL